MSETIQFGCAYRTSMPMHPVEFARKAEALGYDSIWTSEAPNNREPNEDAISVMATMAAVTTRVKVGVKVLITPLHHPAWLAKQLGSLDVLSGGRIIPGLGVGGD